MTWLAWAEGSLHGHGAEILGAILLIVVLAMLLEENSK